LIARIALVVVLFAVTLPAHPTASTPPPSAPLPLTRTLDPARYAGEGAVCDCSPAGRPPTWGCRGPPTPTRSRATSLGSAFGRAEPEERHNRYIAGQAAVVDGADPTGFCQVDLGLAQRKGVEIIVTDEDDKACALAVTIAERMVENLGG
jgi:hypothetical protein